MRQVVYIELNDRRISADLAYLYRSVFVCAKTGQHYQLDGIPGFDPCHFRLLHGASRRPLAEIAIDSDPWADVLERATRAARGIPAESLHDAMLYGSGFSKDGKHVPVRDWNMLPAPERRSESALIRILSTAWFLGLGAGVAILAIIAWQIYRRIQ